MKKRVTIKDIAKASGLSANCISRALMDKPDISQKTKDRVLEIARQMGYIPNSAATTLRKGRSYTIGILYDNLLNPFYNIMTNYIWENLVKQGYSFVTLINDKPFFDENIARRALSGTIDGIISFLEPTGEALKLFEEYNVPVVIVGRKSDYDVECVVLDDEGGGRAAAEYLIKKGYSHPMYLGESEVLSCSKERADGFTEVFSEHGVCVEKLFNTGFSKQAFEDAIDKLLTRDNPPDCIFAFNDSLALDVLSRLRESKIKTAVIGFDNIQNEIAMNGKITSVGYDKQTFASLAVEKLMKLISDGDTEREITVLKELFVYDGQTA